MRHDPPDANAGTFPITNLSAVRALRSTDDGARRRAFETIISIYWKPVYKYIRFRWSVVREDAEDLTQEFFLAAIEKHVLDGYDSSRARFRTFLRTCVDGSVANARKAAGRLKRGGAVRVIPMDFASAELELELAQVVPPADAAMDEFFHREWVRSVFERAIDRLRAESAQTGTGVHLALFMRYDVDGPGSDVRPTYGDLARDFRLPETQVTNFLALIRRRFRAHVLAALTELTGDDEEYAAAARDLLGVAG